MPLSPSYVDRFSLQGKTALVTGGAGILGRHFCAGLAESGAMVAIADVDEAAASELANDLADRYHVRAVGIGCDVGDTDSVNAMVQRVVSEFGRIDVLHNNAAAKSNDLKAFFAPFEEYSVEQWNSIMNVNVTGMFRVAQAAGRQMISQGWGGSVIQTSSVYGVAAPDQRIYEGSSYLGGVINTPAVYSASKAAVIGLTKYLATYWASHGIRVNALVPGGTESGQNAEFVRRYSARVPLDRMAQADEMVGALLYLASDASSYVTGQSVIVDGGMLAW